MALWLPMWKAPTPLNSTIFGCRSCRSTAQHRANPRITPAARRAQGAFAIKRFNDLDHVKMQQSRLQGNAWPLLTP